VKNSQFWLFYMASGWLLNSATLASHCMTTSWLAAATQTTTTEPNIPH